MRPAPRLQHVAQPETWGPDGTIIFATGEIGLGLWSVPVEGGDPELVTTLDRATGEFGHFWPSFLPGGRHVLFTIVRGDTDPELQTRAQAIESSEIAALDLETGQRISLGIEGSHPRYSAVTGHLIFGLDGALHAVPLDSEELTVKGTPVPVVTEVASKTNGAFSYDLTADGTLLYVQGAIGATRHTLVWVNRDGEATPIREAPDFFNHPRLSPDGQNAAVGRNSLELGLRPMGGDVWIYATNRNTRERLTVDGGDHPIWDPTSSIVMFSNEGRSLSMKQVGVGTDPTPLWTDDRNKNPVSWHPNGTHVAFESNVPNQPNDTDVWLLPVDGSADPQPLIATRFKDSAPAFSPDGKWLAYISDESGQDEVYLQSYPETSRRIPISTDGGREPVWSRDGTELFYRDGYRMISVAVSEGPPLEVGEPHELFDRRYQLEPGRQGHPHYGVAPDGQRFLMLEETVGNSSIQALLVLNWAEELKRLVPIN